ncbi:unnamed protein product [Polarella glacialis]|uniref:Helicase-associated domain-containing protein n=1 Tax=Polarella glacialis TaxID=89957 RepID=A0A813G7M2_POLGL|nr:unnamed protein product [Polarella glacialis]
MGAGPGAADPIQSRAWAWQSSTKSQDKKWFCTGSLGVAQRAARRITKLTVQQIEQLDSLGFVWDARLLAWDKGFEHLMAYQKENDHTSVPQSYNSDTGFKLGSWAHNQRKNRKSQGGGKLEPDQIEQLDSMGFAWDVPRFLWNSDFEHLRAYRKENGLTTVPFAYMSHDGFKLGFWVSSQRQACKGRGGGKLEPDQIEQLDSLGFVWDARLFAWDKGFEHLIAYQQEHDHANVPRLYTSDDGFKLGRWVYTQRTARKGQGGRKLEPDKIEQLDSMGFVWSPRCHKPLSE